VTAPEFSIGKLLFAEPKALWVGVAAVALLTAGIALDQAWRRKLAGRLGERKVLRAMISSVSPMRRRIKIGCLVAGLLGIAIALGDPRIKKETTIENRGLDVVFALDVSKSMMVGDVPPSRLDQARKMAKELLKVTPGDRVAGVAFGGGAAHFPLTHDHEVTGAFVTDFGPNDVPPGSDLGEAIRVARCLLRKDLYDQLGCPGLIGRRGHGGDPLPGDEWEDDRRRRRDRDRGGDDEDDEDDEPALDEPEFETEERGKAIILFTDGTDEADKAEEEVVVARQLGITVFIVGFGTEAGGEVWDVDDLGNPTRQKFDESGAPVISKRDDAGMQALAVASGDPAHYLIAPPTGEIDVDALGKALSTVKRGVSTQRVKQARPVFHWFLFPAFMLLVIEALISTRKRTSGVVA
jgi:hypothetical protein